MNIPLSPTIPRPSDLEVRQVGTEQRLILNNVKWADYLAIGNALRDRPGLRLTYDRGTLEFMSISFDHERFKTRFGHLLFVMADEAGLAIQQGGTTTFRREELERGVEPDDCYWIANEPAMRMCREWDPEKYPPPDLILEVEITRSALDRMAIFAAMGVPEVWRCNREGIRVYLLQTDKTYREAPSSPNFPAVPVTELLQYLEPNPSLDLVASVRAFREWVREVMKPRRGRKTTGKKRKPRGSK